MRPSKSSFITACQQMLVLGAVLAVLAPAAGVISLDVVTRHPADTAAGLVRHGAIKTESAPALVATRPVDAHLTSVALTPTATSPQVKSGATGRVAAINTTSVTADARLLRRSAGTVEVRSTPQAVDDFGTVGLTWAPGTQIPDGDLTVKVRTETAGVWSPWMVVPYDADHGPDPGSAEAADQRPGTDAVIVGDVDSVQVTAVSADGTMPADLQLALITPGTATTEVEAPAINTGKLDAARAASAGTTADGTDPSPEPSPEPDPATDPATDPSTDPATDPTLPTDPATDPALDLQSAAVTAKPQIFSRAQWGADERLRDPSSLHYYEVHAGFVHHTVNANDYTRAEVPGILRSIYAYHTQSRGWSDIGYNFLVDRFGRIWEGRFGGVDRPVVGAHTLGYNDYSFAMSAIGNFEKVQPSATMLDAYGRLFAWKLSLHGVNAASTRQRVGDKDFLGINGHRDAASTACPGKYLYARLSTIRSLAASYQSGWGGRQRRVNVASTAHPDLLLRRAADKAGFVLPTAGLLRLKYPRVSQSAGWAGKDWIVASPDLTGDGKTDLFARDQATGRSMIHPGDGAGHFGTGIRATDAFRNLDLITAVGDLNGDRRKDLVARNPETGALLLFKNLGGGSFRRVLLSADFASYNLISGVGDLTGDRRPDLVARGGAGVLWLFPGTGSAALGTPIRVAGSWSGYDVITGYGDYTRDGRRDLFARVRATGEGVVFPSLGHGTFGHWLGPLPTVKGLTQLTSGGNVTDGGPTDLVARRGDALVVVAHTNTYDTSAPIPMGTSLASATVILNVGDWDRDGHGDLITRATTGDLYLRLGDGAGLFSPGTKIGSGFGGVGLLAAVGDVTGDGYPDLQGQPARAGMRIYPGRGASGLGASYVAHGNIAAAGQIGVGLWDGDGAPDSLFRVGTRLALYPGNGPGGLMDGTPIDVDLSAYDWVVSVGQLVGTAQADLVVREKATGYLWVLPGAGNALGKRVFLAEGYAGYDLVG